MGNPLNLTGYKLTFDDEFGGLSVSQNGTGTTWRDIRPGSRLTANSDIGFGISAFLDPASGYNPFAVGNGALNITASPTPATPSVKAAAGQGSWVSGLVSTEGNFYQQYGYFEMRAEMPAGIGAWPAFWMCAESGNWPPELDAIEWYADNPKNYVMTTHSNNASQGGQAWYFGSADLTRGYHTYGVLWDAQHVTMFFDGTQVGQLATPADMNTPMYLMANLAMKTGEAGTLTGSPQTMKIDYVRAFSNASGATATGLQPISSPDGADTTNLHGATAANTTQGVADTLVLHLSEDAWNGNAAFTVSVDGIPVGGTQEVSALHGSGASADFTLSGHWGAGLHQVAVSFINDAYGGTPQTDRNLYVDGITYDGKNDAGATATMLSAGTRSFAAGGSTATVAGTPDTLLLQLSEDAWQGDARFTVTVDGKPITAPETVSALRSLGNAESFAFSGNFGSGQHQVSVGFINDAYGGTPQTDRNLYVNAVQFDGKQYGSGVTTLLGNGAATFTV